MRMIGRLTFLLFLCGLPAGGCIRAAHDERPVTVFAAASTIDAMSEILESFDAGATNVRVNYASSSALAMLVTRGTEADIFLSANQDWADRVQQSVNDFDRIDLLGNSLVVIAPEDSPLQVNELATLSSTVIRRIAIADPFVVPAGIYARQQLVAAGLWQRIEPRVAATADVRQALALVEQQAADVGVVYATDADSSKLVKVLMRLPGSDSTIVYPLLLLRKPNQNAVVTDLYEFLKSDTAKAIFERHGFRFLPESN